MQIAEAGAASPFIIIILEYNDCIIIADKL